MSENLPVLPPDDRSPDQGWHGWDATTTLPTRGADCWRNWIRKPWNCSIWVHVTGIYQEA